MMGPLHHSVFGGGLFSHSMMMADPFFGFGLHRHPTSDMLRMGDIGGGGFGPALGFGGGGSMMSFTHSMSGGGGAGASSSSFGQGGGGAVHSVSQHTVARDGKRVTKTVKQVMLPDGTVHEDVDEAVEDLHPTTTSTHATTTAGLLPPRGARFPAHSTTSVRIGGAPAPLPFAAQRSSPPSLQGTAATSSVPHDTTASFGSQRSSQRPYQSRASPPNGGGRSESVLPAPFEQHLPRVHVGSTSQHDDERRGGGQPPSHRSSATTLHNGARRSTSMPPRSTTFARPSHHGPAARQAVGRPQ